MLNPCWECYGWESVTLKQPNVQGVFGGIIHLVGSFSVGHKPKVWVLLVYVWVSGSEFLNDPIPVFVL